MTESDRVNWAAMEKNMDKAMAQVRRRQLTLDGLIALASFVGGCIGIGWVAKTYLGRIEDDLARATALLAAQGEQIKTLGDSNARAHDRIASCELKQAVDEKAFTDLKEGVRDMQLRSGALVRGKP